MKKQNLIPTCEKNNDREDARYSVPELHDAGSAVELVQGRGGLSGADVTYRYFTYSNEEPTIG